MKSGLLLSVGAAALLLAGCGGGSGGGSGNGGSSGGGGTGGGSTVTNRAPVFTSGASASVAEFTSGPFYTATATDPDGDSLTYSIIGGADAARFALAATGALQFVSAPTTAAAEDSDGNNVYQVVIQVSDGRLAATLALAVTVTSIQDDIAVRRITTGFVDPIAISPIGQTRDFVLAERDGDVFRVDGSTGMRTALGNIFSGQLADTSDWRVVALAAAPDFAASGSVLAMVRTPTALFIQEFVRNVVLWGGNFSPFVSATAASLSNETSGWIGYAPDGTAFALIGDGTGSSGSSDAAQDPASRLGKIVRIGRNPDPYAGASPQFFLTSVVGSGLHQPVGGALSDGELIFADRGQSVAEEINRVVLPATGANFGWPFREGTQAVQTGAPTGLIDPALHYPRGTGPRAGTGAVGGQIYSGNVPSLAGRYVFGDRSGAIWSVSLERLRGGTVQTGGALEVRTAHFAPDAGSIDSPVAFVSDATGVLYILDSDGELFRVDRI